MAAAANASSDNGGDDHTDVDAEEEDRLRDIHRHLANDRDASSSSSWLPLESSPDIFNAYARATARLPPGWEFVDVLGLGGGGVGGDDDERGGLMLLSSSPASDCGSSPARVAAAILLFPTTDKIYERRRVQKARLLDDRNEPLPEELFHIEQVKGFGNACGTIAATHVLLNAGLATPDVPDPFGGGPSGALRSYKEEASRRSAGPDSGVDALRRERGRMLVRTRELHRMSDGAARDDAAQTACPESGDTYLGHHYCAFVPVAMRGRVHVVELDGTKVRPVDHGPVPLGGGGFLSAVASVVRKEWMSLEPDRIDFSLMALVQSAK
ncbi:hypothetical protein ACHAWF_009941 [Thalassiosira exigua]